MEWWQAIIAVCTIVGTTIGAILGVAKLRGENTKIFVDTAEVSIGVVGKSRDMLASDVAELRKELRQVQARADDMETEISLLRTQLRGEKAENIVLTRENQELREKVEETERLKARVTELERSNSELREQVAALRSDQDS